MSDQIQPNDGGPAFSCGPMGGSWTDPDGYTHHQFPGSTGKSLRDDFAGKAMASMAGLVAFYQPAEDMLKKAGVEPDDFYAFTARLAYGFADAMLMERERKP